MFVVGGFYKVLAFFRSFGSWSNGGVGGVIFIAELCVSKTTHQWKLDSTAQ